MWYLLLWNCESLIVLCRTSNWVEKLDGELLLLSPCLQWAIFLKKMQGGRYIVHNVLHAVQARHIRSALQSVYGGEMHDSEAGVHFTPILHEWNECDMEALAHAVQDVIEYIFREKTHDKQNNHNIGWLHTERCDKTGYKLSKTHSKILTDTTATLTHKGNKFWHV